MKWISCADVFCFHDLYFCCNCSPAARYRRSKIVLGVSERIVALVVWTPREQVPRSEWAELCLVAENGFFAFR